MTGPSKFLSQRDLAERWGVSRNTIWRWRKEGRPMPPALSMSRKSIRFKLEDVEAFERRMKTTSGQ